MLLFPNAKINLGLNVVGRRPDGYHDIETVFYPIGLCDVLSIVPSATCTDYSFSTGGIPVGGDAEDNLVVKAYRLLQRECALPPVDISLEKRIPFGAGLGGGSADAAFMLRGLNELFALGLSADRLEQLAARLGADCPVFVRNKPVFATGIGNVFSPISLSLEGYTLLVVKPGVHVSTAEAYSRVTPRRPAEPLTQLLARPVDEWRGRVVNDFEESVFALHPQVRRACGHHVKRPDIHALRRGLQEIQRHRVARKAAGLTPPPAHHTNRIAKILNYPTNICPGMAKKLRKRLQFTQLCVLLQTETLI